MTRTEMECLLQWLEAAVRFHQDQAARHRDQAASFERIHSALCYPRKGGVARR